MVHDEKGKTSMVDGAQPPVETKVKHWEEKRAAKEDVLPQMLTM